MTETEVVYSTATGEKPKGALTKTKEATDPLPPPVRSIARRTAKKHAPRVVAKAEPLHKDIKVHSEVWKKAKEILAEGRYQTIEVVDDETVIVR
jgi:hypothetical protein